MPLPPVPHPLGTPFIELQSVDSTNNYALRQIHEKLALPGACYFTHEQTTGKGQRGKLWQAAKDANITLSIVLKPLFLTHLQQFQLSACTAIAAHSFFSKYAGNETAIKWPNDLYWKNRKAGGILIESVVRSGDGRQEAGNNNNLWQWAVLGVGININQVSFDPALPNPVSLKQITGKNYDTLELAKEFCTVINHFYQQLATEGFEPMIKLYRDHLYKKGETVKLKKDNRTFEASIIDVSDTGELIIKHAFEEKINFGEVEWVISE